MAITFQEECQWGFLGPWVQRKTILDPEGRNKLDRFELID
jgi:hypothetical protein